MTWHENRKSVGGQGFISTNYLKIRFGGVTRLAPTFQVFIEPPKKERMRPKKDERSHCRGFSSICFDKKWYFSRCFFFPKKGEHFFGHIVFPWKGSWSFFFIHANVRFLSSPKASIWCRPHLLQRTRRPLLRSLKNRQSLN